MNVIRPPIDGLLVIEPRYFKDDRGFFGETYQQQRYTELGLPLFIQDNWSSSKKGVLRGLHFQQPRPQGKLVMVTRGAAFDVAVDIRKASPTFGKHFAVELTPANGKQFWIPAGFAHGFLALEDDTHFLYKCTDVYVPDAEAAIVWSDPDLGIAWPLQNPLVSGKDGKAPRLKDAPKLF
jgi:dTDP-4-dehydrorhamnose 3,5-epimerase